MPRDNETVGPSIVSESFALWETNCAIVSASPGPRRWVRRAAFPDDESLRAAIGPVGGQYAENTRASFVLHMLDEFIHHGAEIAMLRDLYRSATSDTSPATTVEEAGRRGECTRVIELVGGGATVDNVGTTALHLAAGAAELEVARLLVAHGGDLAARDPEFNATPAEWAAYFGHSEVAAALSEPVA